MTYRIGLDFLIGPDYARIWRVDMDQESFDRLIKLMIVLYSRYDPEQGGSSYSSPKTYKSVAELLYDFAKVCPASDNSLLVGSRYALSKVCNEALNVQKILILNNERGLLNSALPEFKDSAWAMKRIERIESEIIASFRNVVPPVPASRELFGSDYPDQFYPDAVKTINQISRERAEREAEKARVKKEKDEIEGELVGKKIFGPLWKTYKPVYKNGDAYLVDEDGNEQKMSMGSFGPVSAPKQIDSLDDLERDLNYNVQDYDSGEDY
jgi:hypothetical protein